MNADEEEEVRKSGKYSSGDESGVIRSVVGSVVVPNPNPKPKPNTNPKD